MKRLFRVRARRGEKPAFILMEGGSIDCIMDANSLFQIEIFPSMKCNVNCLTCDRGREGSELKDFGSIATLYDNLRKEATFSIANFRITGGEPTIYPKINDLISFLHDINPFSRIDLITNGIEISRISAGNLKKVNLNVSIYPHTVDILKRSVYLRGHMKRMGKRFRPTVLFHDDMNNPGTKHGGGYGAELCFSAVLLAGTGRVYPCCRAHRLEQDHNGKYHLRVNTPGLYGKLKSIIEDTDLCLHCPRSYKDRAMIRL